jgi:hypothetical protein
MPQGIDDDNVGRHQRMIGMVFCVAAVVVTSCAWSGWSLKDLLLRIPH